MEEQEERVDGAGDLRGREGDGLDPRRASISNKTLKCSLFMSTCVRKDVFFFNSALNNPVITEPICPVVCFSSSFLDD